MKQGDQSNIDADIEEVQEITRRESVPLIFDHSYTERQSNLDRETKWLNDKARELHKKLAVLKQYQHDIEERTRILREKNIELMERNQQLSLGNRELMDMVVEANYVRREREEELRAFEEEEYKWGDNAIDSNDEEDIEQNEP